MHSKKGDVEVTTRDEEEKKKRAREKRQHLRLFRGREERPDLPGNEAQREKTVLLALSRDQLARLVRLAQWGLWARQVLLALLYLLCSSALVVGLLAILRAFRK